MDYVSDQVIGYWHALVSVAGQDGALLVCAGAVAFVISWAVGRSHSVRG
jgi:hypothetical protein